MVLAVENRMKTTTIVDQVILKAADIIRERGHSKGMFARPNGSVCMNGALALACGQSDPQYGSIVGSAALMLNAAQIQVAQSLGDDAQDAVAAIQTICDYNNRVDADPIAALENAVA